MESILHTSNFAVTSKMTAVQAAELVLVKEKENLIKVNANFSFMLWSKDEKCKDITVDNIIYGKNAETNRNAQKLNHVTGLRLNEADKVILSAMSFHFA